jgi:RimJ/RimL family protein N-acetyltransferase
MPAPTLHTPRLTLRPHAMADLAPLYALLESDRARFMGGPLSRRESWFWIASEVGSWELKGHGSWAVDTRDGQFLGQVGINQPQHFPELEIGWVFLETAEGKGYAFEAAQAALDWAWEALPITTLVSYIHIENHRSIALAQRLGATPDPTAAMPAGDTPADTVVYRHGARAAA